MVDQNQTGLKIPPSNSFSKHRPHIQIINVYIHKRQAFRQFSPCRPYFIMPCLEPPDACIKSVVERDRACIPNWFPIYDLGTPPSRSCSSRYNGMFHQYFYPDPDQYEPADDLYFILEEVPGYVTNKNANKR